MNEQTRGEQPTREAGEEIKQSTSLREMVEETRRRVNEIWSKKDEKVRIERGIGKLGEVINLQAKFQRALEILENRAGNLDNSQYKSIEQRGIQRILQEIQDVFQYYIAIEFRENSEAEKERKSGSLTSEKEKARQFDMEQQAQTSVRELEKILDRILASGGVADMYILEQGKAESK